MCPIHQYVKLVIMTSTANHAEYDDTKSKVKDEKEHIQSSVLNSSKPSE